MANEALRSPTTAMILAAGFGSRLSPLSNIRPKPLFPVLGETMLGHWVEKLRRHGFKKIVINAHHLAGQIEVFAAEKGLIVSREEEILGTGGGIKKAERHLGGEPFLLVNSDIYTDLPIEPLMERIKRPKRLAALALVDNALKANLAIGDGDCQAEPHRILAIREPAKVPGEVRRLAYAGLMALSPEIFSLLPQGASDLVAVLMAELGRPERFSAYFAKEAFWRDMGSLKDYWELNRHLAQGRIIMAPGALCRGQASGFVVLGEGALVEEGALVRDSVIWPGVTIGRGALAEASVVARDLPPGLRVRNSSWPET